MLKFLLPLLVLACCFSANAQEKRLIQLSGVVISSDSLEQLPYATIFNKTVSRGTTGDYFGFFSLVVQPGDTILFAYLGHEESSFIVPDTLTEPRYSIVHMMVVDTVHTLPEFIVYPWPSREAFAKAFVEMDATDDAIRRAQKELSGESLAFIAARVSTDASLSFNYAMNQQNTQIYNMRQMPQLNVLNPFAWAKFIDAWKKGELQRE